MSSRKQPAASQPAEPSAKRIKTDGALPEPQYWMLKSEPSDYSIVQMEKDGETDWDGVRNRQAANFMRKMRVGDAALFYHSAAGKETGVVGEVQVCATATPDPADPRFVVVGVRFASSWMSAGGVVPLTKLKAWGVPGGPLSDLKILRQPRLSVSPVTADEYRCIRQLQACAAAAIATDDASADLASLLRAAS